MGRGRTFRATLAATALALLAVLLAACGPAAAERELQEARSLWQAHALDAYVIDVQGADGCRRDCVIWRVRVEAGEVSPGAGLAPRTVPPEPPREV